MGFFWAIYQLYLSKKEIKQPKKKIYCAFSVVDVLVLSLLKLDWLSSSHLCLWNSEILTLFNFNLGHHWFSLVFLFEIISRNEPYWFYKESEHSLEYVTINIDKIDPEINFSFGFCPPVYKCQTFLYIHLLFFIINLETTWNFDNDLPLKFILSSSDSPFELRVIYSASYLSLPFGYLNRQLRLYFLITLLPKSVLPLILYLIVLPPPT